MLKVGAYAPPTPKTSEVDSLLKSQDVHGASNPEQLVQVTAKLSASLCDFHATGGVV